MQARFRVALPPHPRRWAGLATCGLVAFVAACQPQAVRPEAPAAEPFVLRILHINDHHSRVAPDTGQVLLLDGEPTQVSFGGFPQLVTAFEELSKDAGHVLKLHAGDAITGDLYFTLFAGEADADLMNQVCFDAFEVGNHEFDAGDIGLKRFLDFLSKRTWECDTPALGANVRPTIGDSPLTKFSARDYLLPRVVLDSNAGGGASASLASTSRARRRCRRARMRAPYSSTRPRPRRPRWTCCAPKAWTSSSC
ncbi:MAG: nadN [Proteobacteria bacterium]|nr:nadN [Pseudomonadota bacterium]